MSMTQQYGYGMWPEQTERECFYTSGRRDGTWPLGLCVCRLSTCV